MRGSVVVEWKYAACLSKNRMYRNGDKRQGLNADTKAEMDAIAMFIVIPFRGYKWTEERIRVEITVYRPHRHVDAQNWVDSVSDAIEAGLHLDDSRFDVVPIAVDDSENPRVVIAVSQGE